MNDFVTEVKNLGIQGQPTSLALQKENSSIQIHVAGGGTLCISDDNEGKWLDFTFRAPGKNGKVKHMKEMSVADFKKAMPLVEIMVGDNPRLIRRLNQWLNRKR